MPTSTDLLQGTLDLLILQTLSLEPMHGWGVTRRIQQVSKDALANRTGFSVLGSLPPRIQGLDQIGLGKFGKQSTSEVLSAYGRWAKAIAK